MQLYTVTLSVHSLMTIYCIFTNNGYYRNDYYREDYNMRLFATLCDYTICKDMQRHPGGLHHGHHLTKNAHQGWSSAVRLQPKHRWVMLLRAGSHQVPRGGEEHPFVQSLGQSWVEEHPNQLKWQTGKRKLGNIDRDSEHMYGNTYFIVCYVSCNIDLHDNIW